MRKLRIVVILILCTIITTGMDKIQMEPKLDGFLGFAWETSFDTVMEYYKPEIDAGSVIVEILNAENREEHNGITDPTDYYIFVDGVNLQGYDASAAMGFGEKGLISGHYGFPSVDEETDVKEIYDRLFEFYRIEYGNPIQMGEGEEGYGAIWMDRDKNILFMVADDTEYFKKLEIQYMAAVNPMMGWLDSEIADVWEEDNGINFDKVLAYDPANPYNPFDHIDDQGQPLNKETEKYDGPYAYTVGNTTVYTEHELEQWLIEDPEIPGRICYDIGAMLIDLWCRDNRGGIFQNSVGFSYILDGENTKGVWFSSPDIDNPKFLHAVTVWHKVGEIEYSLTFRMYERTREKADLILDNYLYGIDREMSVLLLYTLEQMEKDPKGATLQDLDLGRNFYCD